MAAFAIVMPVLVGTVVGFMLARFVVDHVHLHRLAPDATWTRLDAPPLRGPAGAAGASPGGTP